MGSWSAYNQGGTGATTAAGARTNLELGDAALANIGTGASNVMAANAAPNCAANEKLQMSAGPIYAWSCVSSVDETKLPLSGGTMSGEIAMGANKIVGLGTPTNAQDAATKAYVDSTVGDASYWVEDSGDIYRSSGLVGIGTTSPQGILDITSTTSGILIPRMSEGQRDLIAAPVNGMQIYNLTTNKVNYFDGTQWRGVGIAGNYVTSITAGTGLTGGTITETGTIAVNVGTGAGQIVQLDGSGRLPPVDGSQLTNITVGSVTGTLPISQGGTGATTASGARTNLELGDAALANIGTGASNVMAANAAPNCAANEKLQMSPGPVYAWSCVSSVDETKLPLAGGIMSGEIAMGANKIVGLGAPTNAQDAATKAYVDLTVGDANYWVEDSGDIYRSSGNVGIGTTSPLRSLQVSGSHSNAGYNPWFGIFDENGNESMSLGYEANGTIHTSAVLRSNNTLSLKLGTLNTADGIVLLDGGNVGIGNVAPEERLHVAGKIRGTELCIGTDCKAAWPEDSGGTLTSITAGAGLTGGTITETGTIAVDVGTTAGKIVQLDGSARLPPVDGSQLTNIPVGSVTGTLPLNQGGTGATTAAGARANLELGSAALFNAGVGAGNVTVLDGAGRLPPVDGSLLTNLGVAQITGTLPITKGGTGATASDFSAPGALVVYNHSQGKFEQITCSANQILKWDTIVGWSCTDMPSGGGGGGAWQIIDSDYSASVGDQLFVDTSSNQVTVTMPGGPSMGDIVKIVHVGGNLATNKIIIAQGGNPLMGLAEDMEVTNNNISFEMIFVDGSRGWRIK